MIKRTPFSPLDSVRAPVLEKSKFHVSVILYSTTNWRTDNFAFISLAFAEMRLIIARMAYNFDITLAEDSKMWMEEMRILQVWAEPPLNLYLKPRDV